MGPFQKTDIAASWYTCQHAAFGIKWMPVGELHDSDWPRSVYLQSRNFPFKVRGLRPLSSKETRDHVF
jgi:hypothetical protein